MLYANRDHLKRGGLFVMNGEDAIMEKRFEVRPYGVKYMCNRCNKGEMIPTGRNIWTEPPRFEHICIHCKSIVELAEKFPLIKYENITY
jgi:hypothetical protein